MEAAKSANQLITDRKGLAEQVNWTSHKDMKLKRETGTCYWCGDRRGPHAWNVCPANGTTCHKCGVNDHFARVCLAPNTFVQFTPANYQRESQRPPQANFRRGRGRNRGRGGRGNPRNQNVHQIQSETPESSSITQTDTHQVYSLEFQEVYYTGNEGKRYFANLSLSSSGRFFAPLTFQIDTAATCSTLSIEMLAVMKPPPKLLRSPYLLYPYGSSKPLRPLGQVELVYEQQDKYITLVFQVLSTADMAGKPALLSGVDSEKLGLITFNIKDGEVFSISSSVITSTATTSATELPDDLPGYRNVPCGETTLTISSQPTSSCDHVQAIHSVISTPHQCQPSPSPSLKPLEIPGSRKLSRPGSLRKDEVLDQYKDNFEGIGLLGPPVHFQVKENVIPVQMPVHRVPVAKREKEKEALDRYTSAGIITKVEEPTPWCSNELIRETPKKFRVCIDPSQTVNKAIMRPKYQMPTLNEQLHKLYNAKCFSLVDIREGYLHCPLDDESSRLTTMHTSYGRYRWLRLPFGISSAPDEFQMRLATALEGLEGIINVADDILVYREGHTYDEAEKDHDRRFIALMERCLVKHLKLNPTKLKFKLKETLFMGNIISDTGLRADPAKVNAVTDMPTPRDKAAVLRFIGMVNYLSPFCKNLSTIIKPLRALTQNDSAFIWSEVQQQAFDDAKKLIANSPTLMYFDVHRNVVLQVDASDNGLGGALLQPNSQGQLQPVAFTSCSLSATEQGYSQIEKECLAICNAFNRFDQWLYGKADIEVHTDHKPLETIFKKPLNKAPARLQRMMMMLQRY